MDTYIITYFYWFCHHLGLILSNVRILLCKRYYVMFEATQEGLGKNASVPSIHGSLLSLGELLRLANYGFLVICSLDVLL